MKCLYLIFILVFGPYLVASFPHPKDEYRHKANHTHNESKTGTPHRKKLKPNYLGTHPLTHVSPYEQPPWYPNPYYGYPQRWPPVQSPYVPLSYPKSRGYPIKPEPDNSSTENLLKNAAALLNSPGPMPVGEEIPNPSPEFLDVHLGNPYNGNSYNMPDLRSYPTPYYPNPMTYPIPEKDTVIIDVEEAENNLKTAPAIVIKNSVNPSTNRIIIEYMNGTIEYIDIPESSHFQVAPNHANNINEPVKPKSSDHYTEHVYDKVQAPNVPKTSFTTNVNNKVNKIKPKNKKNVKKVTTTSTTTTEPTIITTPTDVVTDVISEVDVPITSGSPIDTTKSESLATSTTENSIPVTEPNQIEEEGNEPGTNVIGNFMEQFLGAFLFDPTQPTLTTTETELPSETSDITNVLPESPTIITSKTKTYTNEVPEFKHPVNPINNIIAESSTVVEPDLNPGVLSESDVYTVKTPVTTFEVPKPDKVNPTDKTYQQPSYISPVETIPTTTESVAQTEIPGIDVVKNFVENILNNPISPATSTDTALPPKTSDITTVLPEVTTSTTSESKTYTSDVIEQKTSPANNVPTPCTAKPCDNNVMPHESNQVYSYSTTSTEQPQLNNVDYTDKKHVEPDETITTTTEPVVQTEGPGINVVENIVDSLIGNFLNNPVSTTQPTFSTTDTALPTKTPDVTNVLPEVTTSTSESKIHPSDVIDLKPPNPTAIDIIEKPSSVFVKPHDKHYVSSKPKDFIVKTEIPKTPDISTVIPQVSTSATSESKTYPSEVIKPKPPNPTAIDIIEKPSSVFVKPHVKPYVSSKTKDFIVKTEIPKTPDVTTVLPPVTTSATSESKTYTNEVTELKPLINPTTHVFSKPKDFTEKTEIPYINNVNTNNVPTPCATKSCDNNVIPNEYNQVYSYSYPITSKKVPKPVKNDFIEDFIPLLIFPIEPFITTTIPEVEKHDSVTNIVENTDKPLIGTIVNEPISTTQAALTTTATALPSKTFDFYTDIPETTTSTYTESKIPTDVTGSKHSVPPTVNEVIEKSTTELIKTILHPDILPIPDDHIMTTAIPNIHGVDTNNSPTTCTTKSCDNTVVPKDKNKVYSYSYSTTSTEEPKFDNDIPTENEHIKPNTILPTEKVATTTKPEQKEDPGIDFIKNIGDLFTGTFVYDPISTTQPTLTTTVPALPSTTSDITNVVPQVTTSTSTATSDLKPSVNPNSDDIIVQSSPVVIGSGLNPDVPSKSEDCTGKTEIPSTNTVTINYDNNVVPKKSDQIYSYSYSTTSTEVPKYENTDTKNVETTTYNNLPIETASVATPSKDNDILGFGNIVELVGSLINGPTLTTDPILGSTEATTKVSVETTTDTPNTYYKDDITSNAIYEYKVNDGKVEKIPIYAYSITKPNNILPETTTKNVGYENPTTKALINEASKEIIPINHVGIPEGIAPKNYDKNPTTTSSVRITQTESGIGTTIPAVMVTSNAYNTPTTKTVSTSKVESSTIAPIKEIKVDDTTKASIPIVPGTFINNEIGDAPTTTKPEINENPFETTTNYIETKPGPELLIKATTEIVKDNPTIVIDTNKNDETTSKVSVVTNIESKTEPTNLCTKGNNCEDKNEKKIEINEFPYDKKEAGNMYETGKDITEPTKPLVYSTTPRPVGSPVEIDVADLKNVEEPFVWFRPDADFWKKLTTGNSYDAVYFFNVKSSPIIKKEANSIVYENGTKVEEIKEIVYENDDIDAKPSEIRITKIFIYPEENENKKQ